MSNHRDPEADDLFVDHLLQQELGAATPRDHAARIAAASSATLASAADKVDAAGALSEQLEQTEQTGQPGQPARQQPRWRYRPILVAAAAVLLVAIGAYAFAPHWRSPSASDGERGQALLDEFHRVMPRYPAHLRDARRRRDLLANALPVLREILSFGQENGDALIARRLSGFEIYAAVIGDREMHQALQARADGGDATATGQLLTTQLITTEDTTARAEVLANLADHLKRQPQVAGTIAKCLEAAELTTPESELLAESIPDPLVANALVHASQLAATSPRRLLGQPLELQGKLFDDRHFDTRSLRGQPVLVCFWATWCRPSLEAIDAIQRVRRSYPELAAVGISCDHDTKALRNYLADHPQSDWPQFFDRARSGWHELAFSSGVKRIPFVLLIDPQGVVRDVDVGAELAAAVRRHLGH